MRRMIVREAYLTKGGAGYQQLTSRVGASEAVIIRAVQDLELHGVVRVSSKDRKQAVVGLSEFVRSEWEWGEWGS